MPTKKNSRVLSERNSMWVLLLQDARHCRKLSSYQIARKTYDPNSKKW